MLLTDTSARVVNAYLSPPIDTGLLPSRPTRYHAHHRPPTALLRRKHALCGCEGDVLFPRHVTTGGNGRRSKRLPVQWNNSTHAETDIGEHTSTHA